MTLAILTLILLCGVNYYMILNSRHKKFTYFNEIFERIGDSYLDQKLTCLLFLNTADVIRVEKYKNYLPEDWVIIFNGPEWLYKVKLSKWEKKLIYAPEIPVKPIKLTNDSLIVLREKSIKKNKYTIIYELQEYIEFEIIRNRSRMIPIAK